MKDSKQTELAAFGAWLVKVDAQLRKKGKSAPLADLAWFELQFSVDLDPEMTALSYGGETIPRSCNS